MMKLKPQECHKCGKPLIYVRSKEIRHWKFDPETGKYMNCIYLAGERSGTLEEFCNECGASLPMEIDIKRLGVFLDD